MNDGIKQLGNYLGETQDRVDHALSRVRAAVPNVERVRDVFDSSQSALMQFDTKETQRVRMTLFFSPGVPVLNNGKCGGCFCTYKDNYIGVADSYPLTYAAVSSSVKVTIAGVRTTGFTYANQAVVISASVGANDAVSITYTYKTLNCTSGYGGCTNCTCDNFNRDNSCVISVGSEVARTQISPVPTGDPVYGRAWGPEWVVQGYYQNPFTAGQPWNTEAGVEQAGIGYLKINSGSIINSYATAKSIPGAFAWNRGAWTLTGSFRPTFSNPNHLSMIIGMGNFLSGGDDYIDRWVIDAEEIYDAGTSGQTPGTVPTGYPFGTMISGSWYNFKWDYLPPTTPPGTNYPSTGYTRIKIWQGATEPTDWLITTENVGGAEVYPYPSNAIFVTISSIGTVTSDVKVEFQFCTNSSSTNTGGWGTGNLGTWMNPNDALEVNTPDSVPTPDYAYLINGKGALEYGPNGPTFGPQQVLKFNAGLELPINIYYEFTVLNIDEVDFNNLIYIGPYHYNDYDSWITFYPAVDTDGALFAVITAGGFDIATFPWPIDTSGADLQLNYTPNFEVPWAHRIQLDNTGVRTKLWPIDQGEPDWQVDVPWIGGPPPQNYFRYVYIESQALNFPYVEGGEPIDLIDNFCLTAPNLSTEGNYTGDPSGGGGGSSGGDGVGGGGGGGGGPSGGGPTPPDESNPPPASGGSGGSGSDPGGDSSGGAGSSGGIGAPAGDLPAVTHTFNGDCTGATDISSALQSFIDALPANGAVWGFGCPGGIYNTGTAVIFVENKTNLTIVGNGAQLRRSGIHNTLSVLNIRHSSENIRIDSLKLRGSNPNPGFWVLDYEHEHGLEVGGVRGLNVNNMTIENVGGDFIYFSTSDDRWTDNVRIHHSYFYGNGRMGIAFTDGVRNTTIDFNTFENVGYYTWDVEPNGHTVEGIPAGGVNILIADNHIVGRPFGNNPDDTSQATGYLFAITGTSGGGPGTEITLTRNTIDQVGMRVGVFNNGGARRNFVFTDNVSNATFHPDGTINTVVSVNGTTNVQITGNHQPMAGGTFENHSSCGGIINVTNPPNILT